MVIIILNATIGCLIRKKKSHILLRTRNEKSCTVHSENKPEEQAIWYIDISYSNHMTRSKSSFSYLNESFHSTVGFGDLSTVKVIGKGNINFSTKNGCVKIISNIFYVPDLKNNLLIVGQLLEKGYVITLRNDSCEISNPSRGTFAIVKMSQNRLFPLKIENIQSYFMAKVKKSFMVVVFLVKKSFMVVIFLI